MPTHRRVLVLVDDDTERQRLCSTLVQAGLQTFGAKAASAGDLESILEKSQGERSVALVQGRDMAHSLELVASLQQSPTTSRMPTIVVTDGADEELLTLAYEIGAADLLRRPFVNAELIARVHAQIQVRRSLESLAGEKHEAQVMLELTQALASSLDFRDILYTVVRRIADVVQVARVSIVLAPDAIGAPKEENDQVAYVVVASDDEGLNNLRIDLAKYPEIRQVLRTRKPLTISSVATHPLLGDVQEGLKDSQTAALSLFPIVWEDQAIGALFLRAKAGRGGLSDHEGHLCQVVSSATAVALRNARVMQSLRDHTQEITFARFEAERRLRELRRYADLFASAAEGIAVIDREGVLLFANPRAYATVGAVENSMPGTKVKQLIHPEDQERAKLLWEGFERGEYPRGVDLRLHHADGDYVVASCSFATLTEDDDSILMSFQDVTEQRRTEAEFVKTMEFLESLIDASVDGIVASDMDGNIILFNQGAERIYGYRAEEVVGRMSVFDLYPGEGAQNVMRRIRADDWGGEGRLEPTNIDALGADGSHIPIRISAAMIYEHGIPVATFGIFTDLRERLRVEQRLAEAQEKLAVSEKQALIAELAGTAAHELNQPLTSVMAYADLLRRKLKADSSEYRAAEIMVREAERMADIVKKIGKMTRYETKSYVGQQKILDLDKAAGPRDPSTVGE